jgi:hypothetical protein
MYVGVVFSEYFEIYTILKSVSNRIEDLHGCCILHHVTCFC